MLSSSYDGLVRVHGIKSGKMLKELRGHTSYVNDAIYSPDGSQVKRHYWCKRCERATTPYMLGQKNSLGKVSNASLVDCLSAAAPIYTWLMFRAFVAQETTCRRGCLLCMCVYSLPHDKDKDCACLVRSKCLAENVQLTCASDNVVDWSVAAADCQCVQ